MFSAHGTFSSGALLGQSCFEVGTVCYSLAVMYQYMVPLVPLPQAQGEDKQPICCALWLAHQPLLCPSQSPPGLCQEEKQWESDTEGHTSTGKRGVFPR